jgi:NTP pyrophosphatase (non-canonical NTP hydrolase)
MKEQKPDNLVVQLAKQCQQDSEDWFADANNMVHHSLGMAGEVGEFCNIVKKIDRGSLDIRTSRVRYDLAMELTDVFIYVLNLAGMMHIDLAETYKIKRTENVQRFGKKKEA